MWPARFRAVLAQLGLTPTAAARLLGVSGATSRRWAGQGTIRGRA
jgi:predicted site-specific integrase-resolvase